MIEEKAIQDLPTLGEIQLRKVVPIEIHEIESIKDRLVCLAVPSPSAKGTLKSAKVRSQLLIQDDGFAVEDHRRAEFGGFLGDRRKTIGPIVPSTCEDPYAAWFNMDGETITVPFYLIEPLRSRGDSRLQKRQRRLDPLGHGIEGQLRLGWVAGLARLASQRHFRGGEKWF